MDKRYQVFVSSTYEDLKEERMAVMQALLELDCIPVGMELFPASSEEQWSLIKREIDNSDYYVLILAGRYGSCNSDGMGYTEMEYRYAVDTEKPVIAFLHKDIGNIAASKTEQTDEGKKKLQEFRTLVNKRLIKWWTNPNELSTAVLTSITKLQKTFPAIGWVKADKIVDDETHQRILDLEKENRRLREENDKYVKYKLQQGCEELAQGNDTINVRVWVEYENKIGEEISEYCNVNITWNELFCSVAPSLLFVDNVPEDEVSNYMANFALDINGVDYGGFAEIPHMNYDDFQKITIQFLALGLINITDRSWNLSDYGRKKALELLAIRKKKN